MLTKVRTSLLNNGNVAVFNKKVATTMPIQDTLKNAVVMQRNVTRHTIKRLQVQCFAKANNRDIILFFAQHSRIKKDDAQIVDDTKLLTVQDGDGSCIGPGLLYYCREMPACLLTNLSTQLGMVNGA